MTEVTFKKAFGNLALKPMSAIPANTVASQTLLLMLNPINQQNNML